MTSHVLTNNGIDWERVKLFKGWFADTLNDDLIKSQNIKNVSIIMVDCDMYLSAKEALVFCAPLIDEKAIIFFDDWNSIEGTLAANNLGESRAFKEFLEENPDLSAEECPQLCYRTADPHSENYSKVFLVQRN